MGDTMIVTLKESHISLNGAGIWSYVDSQIVDVKTSIATVSSDATEATSTLAATVTSNNSELTTRLDSIDAVLDSVIFEGDIKGEYSWDNGTTTGFGLFPQGETESGNSYNIVGSKLYGNYGYFNMTVDVGGYNTALFASTAIYSGTAAIFQNTGEGSAAKVLGGHNALVVSSDGAQADPYEATAIRVEGTIDVLGRATIMKDLIFLQENSRIYLGDNGDYFYHLNNNLCMHTNGGNYYLAGNAI